MLQGCYKIRTPENQPPEPSMKSKTAVHIPGTSHPQQSHVRTPSSIRGFLRFIGSCCWCCCCSPRLLCNLRWLGSISVDFYDFERLYQSDRSGMIRTCFDLLQGCLGHFLFERLLKHTQCISMLMYVNVTMVNNDAIKSRPQKAH